MYKSQFASGFAERLKLKVVVSELKAPVSEPQVISTLGVATGVHLYFNATIMIAVIILVFKLSH